MIGQQTKTLSNEKVPSREVQFAHPHSHTRVIPFALYVLIQLNIPETLHFKKGVLFRA